MKKYIFCFLMAIFAMPATQVQADEGFPCIEVGPGISKYAGEYFRAKFRAGIPGFGFNFFGEVGREFIFDTPHRIGYNGGIGMYFSNPYDYDEEKWNLSYNMSFGKTPLDVDDLGLRMGLDFEYFFGESRSVGFCCGIGMVLGDFSEDAQEPRVYFDFNVGLVLKLWRDD